MKKMILATIGAVLATGAMAQAPSQEQTYGLAAIQRADYNAAEARLSAQRMAEPNEPSVLLNLAYVYGKTGRAEEAAALYGKVLAGENVLMATARREPAWSHDIAVKAMERTRAMASR